MMPTAFLSHGAPDRVLTDSPSHRFLQSFSTLVKKPKGILIISAHWQTQELTLSAPGELETVHDFFGFPNPTNNKKLAETPMPPLPHPVLENQNSIIEVMQKQDILLHFPYQKYDYVSQLIWEAADDSLVDAIKITLYRVASKSDVTKALLHARSKGKKVVVFIEAKARFDEASNLYWGEKLQEAGAKVLYSFPGIKVHTKLLLIRRIENGNRRLYAYLGTGNFNEKTAKIYGDHALLTANPKMANDAEQIFMLLEGKTILPKTDHLLVSPFTSRKGFAKLIDKEIKLANEGKEAYMILKMNSLEDRGMMKRLVEASQAGVKIQMIVRGICCLVPGVKGYTENIEIVSIIDRFLEHARVYVFGNGGNEKMYTASADWMTRNLDRRVEVVIPILDKMLMKELRHIIDLQLADNVKARWIDLNKENEYIKDGKEEKVQSQVAIYNYLKEVR